MKTVIYVFVLFTISLSVASCSTAEGDQAGKPSFMQKKDSISNKGMGDSTEMQNMH